MPKSLILIWFSYPIKQLRAAKSRWMQFFDSKYRIPNARNETNFFDYDGKILLHWTVDLPAAASLHIPISCLVFNVALFFRKKLNNEPPGTNSMTIIIGCFCTHIPISLTMFGWSYCFKMRPSCKNFRFCSSGNVMRHVLTATSFLFDFKRALYTSPKFPYDINVEFRSSSRFR